MRTLTMVPIVLALLGAGCSPGPDGHGNSQGGRGPSSGGSGGGGGEQMDATGRDGGPGTSGRGGTALGGSGGTGAALGTGGMAGSGDTGGIAASGDAGATDAAGAGGAGAGGSAGRPGSGGGGSIAGTGGAGATGGTAGAHATGGSTGGGGAAGSAGSIGGSSGSGGVGSIGGGSGSSGTGGSTGPVTITPGTVWNDVQGKVIQAHGEGIIKVGDTYYWLGEDKTNGSPFQNIKCYSSTDLKNWTFVNNVLTRQGSGDLGPNRIIERPHVIHNASTSQFVMYMHVDSSSYGDRKAGVATSSSVCGSYNYRGSFKPLGHDSLDDTLFQDGTAGYFISEDRTNKKLQIYRLADDYLTVASLAATLPQYESPAVVKIDGTYYIFGSHLTSWDTNDNQYSTATAMSGPWGSWRSFAPSGTKTCNSQVTFILPVTGRSGTTYMFLGDRWNSSKLDDSRYIWQPLTVTGTKVSMTCANTWTINAAAGTLGP